jgi:soluble lytic murein transglycosylase-like protein
MAGLLDLYGGALTPDQTQALQQRGLLGFLGGMAKSGALNFEAPFLSGRVPGGFAAGLAGGAAGMGEAQDSAALRAMQAQELGLKAQELRGKLGLFNAASQTPPPMYGGAPNTAGPSTAAPGGQPAGGEAPSGLLPALGAAVEQVESGGKPDAVSPAGAIGLRQIMPSTAADYGVTDKNSLFDPNTNRQLGDKILGDLYGRYNGNLDATLVAYNAGPKVADKFVTAGGDPSVLPAETRAYIPKVKGLLAQFAGNPAANAAPVPAGGLLAQAASGQPPAASPAPQPAAAAPGGMMPGGAINPAYVQWAQQQAHVRTALGLPVPPDIAEAAKLPLVGPTAAATAEAENASKYKYAGPIARETSRNTLTKLGPGETLYDPLKGVVTQTPKLPEFNPNAARDAFNRPMPGIVTFGANGGTVTPTQGGGPSAVTPGSASGSATGNAMLTPGQIKQNEVQGEANVKRSEALYDGIQQQSTQFQRDMNPYLQLSKSILNTPGMYSGAGGQWSLDFNRVKAALGDTNAAMMQEALGKVTAQSVLSQINNQRAQMQESGSNSSRIFSSQVELVEKAAPAMTTTIGGNRFLVNVAERMGTLSNTVAEMAREYKMQHGILDTGFDKQLSDYMKANPVFTKQELEHPQILGAPNVPASIQSPEQLNAWAASMGVKKGDPIRLDDGSVRKLP